MGQPSMFEKFRDLIAAGVLIFAALHVGPARGQGSATPPRSAAQLEQLVAPIALYPDSLLSQILMASTYPLELVAGARWSQANPTATGDALQTAMQQQPWDPSVKALTAISTNAADDEQRSWKWTQQLGDVFLAQQSDVLDAVQRLRARGCEWSAQVDARAEGERNRRRVLQRKGPGLEESRLSRMSTRSNQQTPMSITFRSTIQMWCMGHGPIPTTRPTIGTRRAMSAATRSRSRPAYSWVRRSGEASTGTEILSRSILSATTISTEPILPTETGHIIRHIGARCRIAMPASRSGLASKASRRHARLSAERRKPVDTSLATSRVRLAIWATSRARPASLARMERPAQRRGPRKRRPPRKRRAAQRRRQPRRPGRPRRLAPRKALVRPRPPHTMVQSRPRAPSRPPGPSRAPETARSHGTQAPTNIPPRGAMQPRTAGPRVSAAARGGAAGAAAAAAVGDPMSG